MMLLPWILCGVLLLIAAALGIKLMLLRRSVDALCADLAGFMAASWAVRLIFG